MQMAKNNFRERQITKKMYIETSKIKIGVGRAYNFMTLSNLIKKR